MWRKDNDDIKCGGRNQFSDYTIEQVDLALDLGMRLSSGIWDRFESGHGEHLGRERLRKNLSTFTLGFNEYFT